MRTIVRRPAVLRAAVGALVFAAAAADLTISAGRETTVMHVDEPRMLNRGFLAPELYAEVLRTGTIGPGWSGEEWQNRKPPLGNLVITLGLWLGGAERPAQPYDYWPGRPAEQNRLPTSRVLHAGRLLVPLCAGAATATVFVLTTEAVGVIGGLAAALLFQLNPVVRLYGPRALADLPMTAAGLWVLWYLVRRVAPLWRAALPRLLGRAIVLGGLVGTATAVKQNGALVGCAAGVVLLLWTAASARRDGRRALVRGALATTLAAAAALTIYVAVNPYLWLAPVSGIREQVEAWEARFHMHRRRRPDTALASPAERVAAVGRTLAGGPFTTLPTTWATGALVVAGALALARRAAAAGVYAPATILLVWGMITTAIVALWIPLDWERYHLPVVTVVAVVAGGSGGWLPERVRLLAG